MARAAAGLGKVMGKLISPSGSARGAELRLQLERLQRVLRRQQRQPRRPRAPPCCEYARRSGDGGAGAGVVVGASAIYFMYPSDPFLYQSGPFHANHTCAGIMAYTREYAQTNHFDTAQNRAEERLFLRGYRQKVVQIDASYRIYMPLAHDTNTVDKSRLQRRKTDIMWFDHVVTKEAMRFYLDTYPLHLPFARSAIGIRENDAELSEVKNPPPNPL
jgi:hypothetical protein